mmetsp:Transcript_2836/g.11436  ORF Transcript_2836/g.11436 Transcript_2836/m.11436 type:complete len:320 (+) Transcript_2836:370-1329(+)
MGASGRAWKPKRRASSSSASKMGMAREIQPTGREVAPMRMHMPHWAGVSAVVSIRSPPNSTMMTWPTMMRKMTKRAILDSRRPWKMLISSWILRACSLAKSWSHTNMLKMLVRCARWPNCPGSRKKSALAAVSSKVRKRTRKICQMELTAICFTMMRVMRDARPWGAWRSRESEGGSVARARAAAESMRRLIQSSWDTDRGKAEVSPSLAPDTTKVTVRATTLMVSWRTRNLRMFSITERPQRTARTMEAKLSSRMTTLEASLATSVPAMPMASPTWAALRAGASLEPSPVTATMSLRSLRVFTRRSLSVGLERASTAR